MDELGEKAKRKIGKRIKRVIEKANAIIKDKSDVVYKRVPNSKFCLRNLAHMNATWETYTNGLIHEGGRSMAEVTQIVKLWAREPFRTDYSSVSDITLNLLHFMRNSFISNDMTIFPTESKDAEFTHCVYVLMSKIFFGVPVLSCFLMIDLSHSSSWRLQYIILIYGASMLVGKKKKSLQRWTIV